MAHQSHGTQGRKGRARLALPRHEAMLGQPVQPNVGAELMARPLETPEAEPVEGAKRQDMWWYTRALHADDGRDRVVPCSSRVARVAPVS